MGNYTSLYQASDVGAVSIDLIVGVGALFVGLVAIIGMILLYRFLRGKKLM